MDKKRTDIWNEQYRTRRYLQNVNEEVIGQRLRDIVNNLIVLTENGQAAPRLPSEGGGYWMMKLSHIREEFHLRGLDFPENVLKETNLPRFTYPEPPKSAGAIKGKNLVKGNYLIKYGKLKYLKEILDEGVIRIAPASFYKDPSLNYAIQDNELILETYGLPQEVKITVIDQKTGEKKGPFIILP